jgi:hypothetical protein
MRDELEALLLCRFEKAENGAAIIKKIRDKNCLTPDDRFIIITKREMDCANSTLRHLREYVEYLREYIEDTKSDHIHESFERLCILSDIDGITTNTLATLSGVEYIERLTNDEMELVLNYYMLSKNCKFMICTIAFPYCRTGREFLGYKGISLDDLIVKCILGMKVSDVRKS